MIKRFASLVILAIFAVAMFSSFGFASEKKATSKKVASQNKAENADVLDELNLKKNILMKFGKTLNVENIEGFGVENIVISAKEPVKAGDMSLWVVKVKVENLPNTNPEDTKGMVFDLVVDSSGTYQIFDMHKVAETGSIFAEARREMGKIVMPEGFGHTIYKGKGKSTILFVSDPFCHFCREEFKFLTEHKDSFKEVIMLTKPAHPSTAIIGGVLMYAHEKLGMEKYMDLLSYTYSQLPQEPANIQQRIKESKDSANIAYEKAVLDGLLSKFKDLHTMESDEDFYFFIKGKYVTLLNDEVQRLSDIVVINGTPLNIIDGYVVPGFQGNEIAKIAGIDLNPNK